MEDTFARKINILNKMSLSTVALPYYGYMHQSHKLMKLFSHDSNQLWLENIKRWSVLLHNCKQFRLVRMDNAKSILKLFHSQPEVLACFKLQVHWFIPNTSHSLQTLCQAIAESDMLGSIENLTFWDKIFVYKAMN